MPQVEAASQDRGAMHKLRRMQEFKCAETGSLQWSVNSSLVVAAGSLDEHRGTGSLNFCGNRSSRDSRHRSIPTNAVRSSHRTHRTVIHPENAEDASQDIGGKNLNLQALYCFEASRRGACLPCRSRTIIAGTLTCENCGRNHQYMLEGNAGPAEPLPPIEPPSSLHPVPLSIPSAIPVYTASMDQNGRYMNRDGLHCVIASPWDDDALSSSSPVMADFVKQAQSVNEDMASIQTLLDVPLQVKYWSQNPNLAELQVVVEGGSRKSLSAAGLVWHECVEPTERKRQGADDSPAPSTISYAQGRGCPSDKQEIQIYDVQPKRSIEHRRDTDEQWCAREKQIPSRYHRWMSPAQLRALEERIEKSGEWDLIFISVTGSTD